MPNKCKLVVSDFHVGSGMLKDDGEVNPLECFTADSRFIGFLDHYSTGDYKRADVELILNGDFLNTLQVDYQEKYPTEISKEVALEKTRRIWKGHPELFDAMRRFADAAGHRVTYIVGNHDPAIHWPEVRDEISRRLGAPVNYPGFHYAFDGVWVEHGHQYTAANRMDPAKIFVKNHDGEVLLNIPWGSIWVIEYLNEIKRQRPYIDRVQPFGRYMLLSVFLNPRFAVPALVKLANFFVKERLSFGRWKHITDYRRTYEILSDISLIPQLDKPAKKILAKPGYHTVIFGHNHQPAFRRFGHDKLYINTGTWNDIIHLDVANLGRQRRMTYAFIDYSVRGKPTAKLKMWKGTRSVEEDVIF